VSSNPRAVRPTDPARVRRVFFSSLFITYVMRMVVRRPDRGGLDKLHVRTAATNNVGWSLTIFPGATRRHSSGSQTWVRGPPDRPSLHGVRWMYRPPSRRQIVRVDTCVPQGAGGGGRGRRLCLRRTRRRGRGLFRVHGAHVLSTRFISSKFYSTNGPERRPPYVAFLIFVRLQGDENSCDSKRGFAMPETAVSRTSLHFGTKRLAFRKRSRLVVAVRRLMALGGTTSVSAGSLRTPHTLASGRSRISV